MDSALILMLCEHYLVNPNNLWNRSPFLTRLKIYIIYKDCEITMVLAFRDILTSPNKLMNKKERCQAMKLERLSDNTRCDDQRKTMR